MSKGSTRAPAPPDPVALANAQAGANTQAAAQTAALNRVNEVGPYGAQFYVRPGQQVDPRLMQMYGQGYSAPSVGGKEATQPTKANQPYRMGQDPRVDAMMARPQQMQPQPMGQPRPAPNMPAPQAQPARRKYTNPELLAMGVPADQLPDNNTDDGGSGNDTGPGGAYDAQDWQVFGGGGPQKNALESGLLFGVGDTSAFLRDVKDVDRPIGERAGQVGAVIAKNVNPLGWGPGLVRGGARMLFGAENVTDSSQGSDYYTNPQAMEQGGGIPQEMYAANNGGGFGAQIGGYGTQAGGVGVGGGGSGGAGYGDDPWTRIQMLHPEEQANLDRQRALASQLLGLGQSQVGRISDAVGTPLNMNGLPQVNTPDFSGLPKMNGLNFGNLPQLNQPDYNSLPKMQGFDLSGIQAGPNAQDFINPNQQVIDALYNPQKERLDQRFNRDREALEARLASQGINAVSNRKAYNDAIGEFDRNKNDAHQQALGQATQFGVQQSNNAFQQSMQARQQGVSEVSQMFQAGMVTRQQAEQEIQNRFQSGLITRQQAQQEAMQIAQAELAQRQQGVSEQGQMYGFQTDARQRALQEALTQRNQPLNELATILGSAPSVGTPQFAPFQPQQVQPTDIMGATGMGYQGQLQNYAQQVGARNAGIGAAGTIGAGLAAGYMRGKS